METETGVWTIDSRNLSALMPCVCRSLTYSAGCKNYTYRIPLITRNKSKSRVIFHTIHEGIVALSAPVGVSDLAACNFGPQKE